MIGLLGGIGPFATARYYERVVAEHRSRSGRYPEVAVVSLDFDRFTALENRPDPAPYLALIQEGIQSLARAGAEFVAMTANSPHVHGGAIAELSPLPLVPITDPVAREVRSRDLRRVLLLGIEATARSSLYPDVVANAGIEVVVPAAAEQARIDAIVFDELGVGDVRAASRSALLEIVARHPADAVLLGCTELPLILRPDHADRPLLDTLELHVDAIVRRALEAA